MARPTNSTRIAALEDQMAAFDKRLGLIEARNKTEIATRTANDDSFAKRLAVIEAKTGADRG